MAERDTPRLDVAVGAAAQARNTEHSRALALRLTSPLSVLVAFPSLVLVMGLVLTLANIDEVRGFARREALESFLQRARQAEMSLAASVSEADALLDRVRELTLAHSSDAELAPFAVRLRDLMLRRPGLKWLSASFPDGTFQGVFIDEDGQPRFQCSRILGARTERIRYEFVGEDLRAASKVYSEYDPRQRDFYRLAVERRTRTWTHPYRFYSDRGTGITRTEAIFDGSGALQAVVTADYDMTRLSELLNGAAPGVRLVAFTSSGAILALNGARPPVSPGVSPATRALGFSELPEPALREFFATRGASPSSEPREFRLGSERYMAVERAVSASAELEWRLGAVVHEDVLWARANHDVERSIVSSSLLLLGAVFISAVFAAGISRSRRARIAAEERARVASLEARDLGSYRLETQIGAGGMGEVWKATHRMLARPAAIKLIRTDLHVADRTALEARFELEAFTLARMRSPHTVSILDYGKAVDGRLYLVMELLEGLPLDRVVERFGPLPVARVIPILIGVCRSLAEAHAAGLVHRDVKPSNIFLCHDGDGIERAKVIDFGLVKPPVQSGLTAAGSISGTTDYMAPEQARGESMDGRADLYSLACAAFYLLTGQTVFRGNSDIAVIIAHQTEPPPSVRSVTSQWIPAELDSLMSRCLAKDAEFRPRSATSLARALAEIEIPERFRASNASVCAWWEAAAEAGRADPAEGPS